MGSAAAILATKVVQSRKITENIKVGGGGGGATTEKQCIVQSKRQKVLCGRFPLGTLNSLKMGIGKNSRFHVNGIGFARSGAEMGLLPL
jgi:hypothetical protein